MKIKRKAQIFLALAAAAALITVTAKDSASWFDLLEKKERRKQYFRQKPEEPRCDTSTSISQNSDRGVPKLAEGDQDSESSAPLSEGSVSDVCQTSENRSHTLAESVQTPVYIGNRASRIFHRTDCSSAVMTGEKNRITFSTPGEALRQGFSPCKNCKPGDEDG